MESGTWARARHYGLRGGAAIAALALAINLLDATGGSVGWYQEHFWLVHEATLGVVAAVLFMVGYLANTPLAAGMAPALAGALAGLIGLLGNLLFIAVTLFLQDSSSPLGLLGVVVYGGMYLVVPLVVGGGLLALVGALLSDLQYHLFRGRRSGQ